MSPLVIAVLVSTVLLALLAVPLVVMVRRHRRAVAVTSWPAWRAESRRLPPADRRAVVRAVGRGKSVPAHLAGSALRHGRAVVEVHAVGRRWFGRGSTRTFYAVAAGFGVLSLVLGLLRLGEEGWSFMTATPLVWLYLVPFFVVLAAGKDLQAPRIRRARRAVELAERQLAEADPTPAPPAQRP